MFYLVLAVLFDLALFTTGLAFSITNLEQYNFGLYLILVAIVLCVALTAICCAKPKAIMENPLWLRKLFRHMKNNRTSGPELEELMHRSHDDVLNNMQGIPYLIQAIQYSMETTMYSGLTKPTIITHVASTSSEDVHNTADSWWTQDAKHWSNSVLRLDVARPKSRPNVFPFTESTPLAQETVDSIRNMSHSDEFLPVSRKTGMCTDTLSVIELSEGEGDGRIRKSSSAGTLRVVPMLSEDDRRPSCVEVRGTGLSNMLVRKYSDKKAGVKFKPPPPPSCLL